MPKQYNYGYSVYLNDWVKIIIKSCLVIKIYISASGNKIW